MDSGKMSWKLGLMSSTRDVAYRVGPGVILMILSPLALPPLSWGMNTRASCHPWTGIPPQVCLPQGPLRQVPLPQGPLPQGSLPHHMLTVRSHDGLYQNQDCCLIFLRLPPLFLVQFDQFEKKGQEPL